MQKSTIKKVNDYQSLYDTNTWQIIEKKLSKRKRKRLLLLLLFISILAMGILFVNQNHSKKDTLKETYIPTP